MDTKDKKKIYEGILRFHFLNDTFVWDLVSENKIEQVERLCKDVLTEIKKIATGEPQKGFNPFAQSLRKIVGKEFDCLNNTVQEEKSLLAILMILMTHAKIRYYEPLAFYLDTGNIAMALSTI